MKGSRSPQVPSLPDQNPGRLPAASTTETTTNPGMIHKVHKSKAIFWLACRRRIHGWGPGAGTSGRPQLDAPGSARRVSFPGDHPEVPVVRHGAGVQGEASFPFTKGRGESNVKILLQTFMPKEGLEQAAPAAGTGRTGKRAC